MYVALSDTAQPQSAGCQLPYTAQGAAAYSRAFLERMNLAPGLRAGYVPSASTQKIVDWWRSVGLDPFQPTTVAIAKSKFHCAGVPTADQFAQQMQNKSALEMMARENADLIAANKDLARYFQTVFKNNRFTSAELQTVADQLQKVKGAQVGAPAPAAMPQAPANVKPVVVVKPIEKKIVPVALVAPVAVVSDAVQPEISKVTTATKATTENIFTAAAPPAVMPQAPATQSASMPWLLIGAAAFLLFAGRRK